MYQPGNFTLQATLKLIGKLPGDTDDNYDAGLFKAAAITYHKNNYVILYNKTYGYASVALGIGGHKEQLEIAFISKEGTIKQQILIPFKWDKKFDSYQVASNGDSLLITWHTLYKRENKYFWYILIKDRHNQKE